MQGSELTILSVVHGNSDLLALNQRLAGSLNPDVGLEWVVVDNSRDGSLLEVPGVRSVVVPGPDIDSIPDVTGRASYHHGAGLNAGFDHVATRYLLVLDPDFYLVRPDWAGAILLHMREHALTFLGSTWHPDYYTKYRYFPSVHCMFIDLERAGREAIDFSPEKLGATERRAARLARLRMPKQLVAASMVGATRDTGSRIHRRFSGSRAHGRETFSPFYVHPAWNREGGVVEPRWRGILPDRFSLYPTRADTWVETSFLATVFPPGRDMGWEEYWWQGAPMGVHLRSHGRGFTGSPDPGPVSEFVRTAEAGAFAADAARRANADAPGSTGGASA